MALRMNTGKDKEFEEHPPGTFAGTLIDVVEAKPKPNPKTGEEKKRSRLLFVTSKKMSDGRNFVCNKWVNHSLFKKGGEMCPLVATVEALIAKPIESLDLLKFEDEHELLESLIGLPATVVVKAIEKREGGKMSLIDEVSPLMDGVTPPPVPENWKRAKDRDGFKAPAKSDKDALKRLWTAAASRSVLVKGDQSLKEKIIRDVYAHWGVGSSEEAARHENFSAIVQDIESWEPPAIQEPADESEVPF